MNIEDKLSEIECILSKYTMLNLFVEPKEGETPSEAFYRTLIEADAAFFNNDPIRVRR